ncbi:MAG: complex I NDUFA9 subunit family protein [Pseudomonadota bacterium]
MKNHVTIFGGSGFVGRYITRRLVESGSTVRVAVRKPDQANFMKNFGKEGQVEPVACNICREDDVKKALDGSSVAISCVGTFDASGPNNFDAIQHEGAARIARLSASAKVKTFVHLSSIGADENSDSTYSQTKAKGEQAILSHMPEAVILRPSVIFGPEDQFFNRFAAMTKLNPLLPVVGADTRFQPVYVGDVAEAAAKAAMGEVAPGIYELGGPDVISFKELMSMMLDVIARKRTIVNIPFPIARIMAFGMETAQSLTGGLIPAQITSDQVRSLGRDNVVAEHAKTFADLNINPKAMQDVLPEYLWKFRPDARYDKAPG